MAARTQELSVKLTADESDLVSSTEKASRALTDLRTDIERVDGEDITIDARLELSRINRDRDNLNRVLDGIERRKANPDVGMDTTQLLREERRVRAELDKLDKRAVEIEVGVDPVSVGRLDTLATNLDSLGGVVPGLGRLAGGLRGAGGAAGAAAGPLAAVGIAVAGWKMGEAAADVETLTIQLSSLTGSTEDGAAAFAELQDFAKTTPFALDEVTAAARSLIVAGKDVDELPATLTDLGNAASATGTDLQGMTLVLQQMFLKGKVTNEELMQLAERGLPAYKALADALGVSTDEIQKMAEAGQLGADKIDVLVESMGDMFPGAMSTQADSFNGQMSTLNDSVDQIGQTLGTLFLPMMTDTVKVLNAAAGAALSLAEDFSTADAELQKMNGHGLWVNSIPVVGGLVDGVNLVKGGAEDTNEALDEQVGTLDTLAGISDGYLQHWLDVANATAEINQNLLDQVDIEQNLRELAAGAKPLDLPVNFKVAELGPKELAALENIGSTVSDIISQKQDLIDEGKATNEANAWANAQRKRLSEILTTDFHMSTKEAEALLNRLGLKVADVTKDRDVVIEATPRGFGDTESDLNYLTRDRTVDVTVRKAGTSGFGPQEDVAFLSAAAFSSRSAAADPAFSQRAAVQATVLGVPRTAAGNPVVELAPRTVPIKVFLDGEEIADKMVDRVSARAAIGSLRRRA